MRPGGGKAKGGQFERDVCAQLSLWVSAGKHHDLFWRSAMSGGRATVGRRAGKSVSRQAGDICAVAPEGHAFTHHFYIECKSYADLNVRGFILENKGLLAAFWTQTVFEALSHHRAPMLIAKENRRPPMLLTAVGDWYKAGSKNELPRAIKGSCEIRLLEDMLKNPYDWLRNEPSPVHDR